VAPTTPRANFARLREQFEALVEPPEIKRNVCVQGVKKAKTSSKVGKGRQASRRQMKSPQGEISKVGKPSGPHCGESKLTVREVGKNQRITTEAKSRSIQEREGSQ